MPADRQGVSQLNQGDTDRAVGHPTAPEPAVAPRPAGLRPPAGPVVVLGAALAVAHLAAAVVRPILLDGVPGVVAAVTEAAVAAVLLTAAALARRPERAAPALLLASVALAAGAALRVAITGEVWGGAPLLLAAGLTALADERRRVLPALAGVAGGWAIGLIAVLAGSLARPGVLPGGPGELSGWLQLGLLIGVAAALAGHVRRDRLAAARALLQAHRDLTEQTVIDPVSGAANRRALALVAVPMIDLARRQGQAVHCLVLDVERRQQSSGEGTATGPAAVDADLLRGLAEALRAATRATDAVARWDTGELVVLGPGTGTSPLELERRVRTHLGTTEGLPRDLWEGRVSAGAATLVPWDGGDLETLVHRAQQDLDLRRNLKRRVMARMQADDATAPAAAAPERPA